MQDRPPGLDDAPVLAALEAQWGVTPASLAYVPKGAGGYHWKLTTTDGERGFVTVDDLDAKPWLGADRDAVAAGLADAYAIAGALRDHAGCHFVLAPTPTRGGAPLHRLDDHDRYTVALFPFVDGTVGRFDDPWIDAERTATERLLAELHRATPAVAARASRRGEVVPDRAELEAALAAVDDDWDGGPCAEPARALLAARADDVRAWLARFDELTAELGSADAIDGLVLTHGEPHQANLLRGDGRLLLIDWDTVGLSPPERDLWMLDDGVGTFAAYEAVTGRRPRAAAIERYRRLWTLADLASYVPRLRRPHDRTLDAERALAAVRTYLG